MHFKWLSLEALAKRFRSDAQPAKPGTPGEQQRPLAPTTIFAPGEDRPTVLARTQYHPPYASICTVVSVACIIFLIHKTGFTALLLTAASFGSIYYIIRGVRAHDARQQVQAKTPQRESSGWPPEQESARKPASVDPDRRITSRNLLTEGEFMIWQGRKHPLMILHWWLALVGAMVAFIVIGSAFGNWAVGLSMWLIAMLVIGFKIMEWDHDRLYVTNKRLLGLEGLLTTSENIMPMSKMTDSKMVTTWQSNLLAAVGIISEPYVTLVVESAGQDQALANIPFVPNGQYVHNLIMREVLKG